MNTLLKSIQKLPESKYSLVLILLLSAILKASVLLALEDAVINNDGVRYIAAAKLFARGEFAEGAATYPIPLYPLSILLVHVVVPDWVLAARLLSLISLVLVLIPLYLLTQDLFDRRAAFWASLAFALSPLPNRWTTFVIREPLFVLFFTWAVYLCLRTLQSRRASDLVAAAALSWVATMVRLEGIILFPVYLSMLAGLAVIREGERNAHARNLVIWSVVPACVFAVLWWLVGPERLLFGRLGELADSLQSIFQLKFLANYHHIYAQLEQMEEASMYRVGSQNFAEIARQFLPAIYALGLLRSFVRVLFLVNVVALFVSLRRRYVQEMHAFVLLLLVTYLLVLYYFLLQRDFLENRFLLAPALILYPWIGMGWKKILGSLQTHARPKILQVLVFAIVLLSPLTIYVQLYQESDNVEIKAGRWLAEQQRLKTARIITTDYRIPFYAGREIVFHREGNDIYYRQTNDVHDTKIEAVAIQNHIDLLILKTVVGKEQSLPEMVTYRELKRFVGKKRVVIIYTRCG